MSSLVTASIARRHLVERHVAAEVDLVLRDAAHAAVAGLEAEQHVALHLVLDARELVGAQALARDRARARARMTLDHLARPTRRLVPDVDAD